MLKKRYIAGSLMLLGILSSQSGLHASDTYISERLFKSSELPIAPELPMELSESDIEFIDISQLDSIVPSAGPIAPPPDAPEIEMPRAPSLIKLPDDFSPSPQKENAAAPTLELPAASTEPSAEIPTANPTPRARDRQTMEIPSFVTDDTPPELPTAIPADITDLPELDEAEAPAVVDTPPKKIVKNEDPIDTENMPKLPESPKAPAIETPATPDFPNLEGGMDEELELEDDGTLSLPTLPGERKGTLGIRGLQKVDPKALIEKEIKSEEEREKELQTLFNTLYTDEELEKQDKRRKQFEEDFGVETLKPTEEVPLKAEQKKKKSILEMTPGQIQRRNSKRSPDEPGFTEDGERIDPRLVPERSTRHNYKTLVDSKKTFRKSYNKRNRHLPSRVMREDMFDFTYAAAYRGNMDGLRALLARGVNPNAPSRNGQTPLMGAAISGQVAVVRLLLLRGADPNLADPEGNTALHMAAANGRSDVITALLHMGAKTNMYNKNGKNPRDVATINGHNAVGNLLLPQTKYQFTPKKVMTKRKALKKVAPQRPAIPPIFNEIVVMPEPEPLPRVQDMPFPELPDFLADDANAEPDQPDYSALYKDVPSMQPYWTMSEADQKLWRERLEDWKQADKQFDSLSFEDKVEYNYRRKVLEQIFPNHFVADNALDQLMLDNYMKRWTDFDRQLRIAYITDVNRHSFRIDKYSGNGLNVDPTPLWVDLPELDREVTPEPPHGKPNVPPRAHAYNGIFFSDLSGVANNNLTIDQRLHELIENWKLIDSRFRTMSTEQKIRANAQRRKLLDKLVYDSGVGTYAEAFAKKPQFVIEEFIDAMKKWDDFEDWLKQNMSTLGAMFPPWGGLPENTAELIKQRDGIIDKEVISQKIDKDILVTLEDGSVRSNNIDAALSIQKTYPTHDRTRYRLMRSISYYR